MPLSGDERDRLELLVELASTIDQKRIGKVLLDGLVEIHGIDRVLLYLAESDSGEFRPVGARGCAAPGPELVSLSLPEADSIAPEEDGFDAMAAAVGAVFAPVGLVLVLHGEIAGFVLLGEVPWDARRSLERLAHAAARGLSNADRFARSELLGRERSTLLEVQGYVTRALEPGALLSRLLDSLERVVEFDAAVIFLAEPGADSFHPAIIRGYRTATTDTLHLKTTEGVAGVAVKEGREVIVPRVCDEPRYVPARKRTESELAVPLVAGGETIGVFVLESDEEGTYGIREAELLRAFAAHAAIAIENSRLHMAEIEGLAMAQELRTARSIQRDLLPRSVPRIPGYQLLGVNLPSLEMSGDLYDIVERAGRVVLLIVDVMGKGAPAAMLTGIVHAGVREGLDRGKDLDGVVEGVNRLLCGAGVHRTRFATLFLAELEPGTGGLRYVNAGHDPPMVLSPEGVARRLHDGGLLVGVVADAPYEIGTDTLEPGACLLAYTDGVTETADSSGVEFGEERLIDALRAADPAEAMHRTLRRILATLRHYRSAGPREDDITFLGVRRYEGDQPSPDVPRSSARPA